MDAGAFSDSGVVTAADDVIRVKIDGDRQKNVVKKYGVKGYPTVLFLDSNGGTVGSIVGAENAATVKRNLAAIAKK